MGGALQLGSIAQSPQASPAGGSGDSWAPKLSSDGRYVLFASTADNLVLGTNGSPYVLRIPAPLNVYLRDRTNQTTTLVSVTVSGAPAGPGDSIPVAISTNGRYALFESSASGLVVEDTNAATDVFIRDLASNTTILVSANTNGVPGNGASRASAMTPDGRYVAFVSDASDLVPGDTNGIADVFVRDLQNGATLLVSVGATSTNLTIPVGGSAAPEMTPDGRSVAFFSTATNLVPGAPPGGDLYVRDVVAGQMVWASAAAREIVGQTFGVTNAVSFNHALSADGQYPRVRGCPTRIGARGDPPLQPAHRFDRHRFDKRNGPDRGL